MNIRLHTRIVSLWEGLRGNYWFIPALLTLTAAILALLIPLLDRQISPEQIPDWLFIGEPGGARAILTTIAGSMISVATLTFSITMVVLTLASSQYGSRLLYNFMRDHSNQAVLGIYTGTFIYCLIVLRQITPVYDDIFVPHIAVNTAILLALIGIAVLIFFIHHIADSIQANTVISKVRSELHNSICRFFPEEKIATDPQVDATKLPVIATVTVPASGILQAVNTERLMEIAIEHDLVVKLAHRAGNYLVEDSDLLDIVTGATPDEELTRSLQGVFIIGDHRNLVQDIEFGFHQLVEIALRALSPGINDPFTAISCIDEIGAGLAHIMSREMPAKYLCDDNGKARIHLDTTSFAGIVDSAFNQIRQHAIGKPAVAIKVLQTIVTILPFAGTQEQRDALYQQARLLHETAIAETLTEKDRQDISAPFTIIRNRLEKSG